MADPIVDPKDPPPQDPPKDPPPQDPPPGDPPKDPPADPKAATWPEDWRQRYSVDDAKKLERMSRYASPSAAFDALLSLQSKIGAGELRSTLPKNATAEQITAWRKENGIPEKPTGYELKLGDKFVIPEADKPMLEGFMTRLHATNAPASVVNEAVKWYYDEHQRRTDEMFQKDKDIATASEDALRAEWGSEYRPNINSINALVDTMPAESRELFQRGRLADGTPIMANPAVMKWLTSMSRQINPVTTLVPNTGGTMASAIDDRIKVIEKTMQTDRKAYNADEKMQQELRDLYAAREKQVGK